MICQWRIIELIYAEQCKTEGRANSFIIFEVLLCEKMKTSCFLNSKMREASFKSNHLIKIKIVQQIDQLIF